MCADYPQSHIYSGRDGKDEPGGIHSLYCGGEPHLGYCARCVGSGGGGILGDYNRVSGFLFRFYMDCHGNGGGNVCTAGLEEKKKKEHVV